MNESVWQFAINIWLSGGFLMIPLFLLAALVFANSVQLYFYISRQSLQPVSREELATYVREPHKAPGNYARILQYVEDCDLKTESMQTRFEEVQLALLAIVDRRIQFLQTLVAAAPLMGLLGTVIGMLATFVGLASSGGETVDVRDSRVDSRDRPPRHTGLGVDDPDRRTDQRDQAVSGHGEPGGAPRVGVAAHRQPLGGRVGHRASLADPGRAVRIGATGPTATVDPWR